MFPEALLLDLGMAKLYSSICQYQPQLLKQVDFCFITYSSLPQRIIPCLCLPLSILNISSSQTCPTSILPVSNSNAFSHCSNTTGLGRQDDRLQHIEPLASQNMTNRTRTKQHMAQTDKTMLMIYIPFEMYPKKLSKHAMQKQHTFCYAKMVCSTSYFNAIGNHPSSTTHLTGCRQWEEVFAMRFLVRSAL